MFFLICKKVEPINLWSTHYYFCLYIKILCIACLPFGCKSWLNRRLVLPKMSMKCRRVLRNFSSWNPLIQHHGSLSMGLAITCLTKSLNGVTQQVRVRNHTNHWPQITDRGQRWRRRQFRDPVSERKTLIGP